MNLKEQPIPEPSQTTVGGPVTTGLPKNTPKSKPEAPPAATPRPSKLGLDSATNGKQPASNGSVPHGAPTAKQANGVDHSRDKGKAPSREVEKTQATSNTAKASPKPLATSAGKAVAKPAKSPTVNKIPKTPTDMTASNPPVKTPDKAQQKEKTATPRAGTASAKAAGSSSIKRPPPLTASPAAGTGFVKPKPKSPTRPVKLPASLTTHTAASGSKVNGGSRQSLSRASGVISNGDTHGRSPSRGSVSTSTNSATRLNAVKSLKRQNSTINRPRPSIGPPPKQPARDHPPTKKEKEIDEGFLARMTRPTQAFASKTVGKAATSPPRKVATAPAPAPAPAPQAKRPVRKSVSPAAKASSSRTTLPVRPKAPAGPSSQQEHSSTASQIAIRVEEADTAEKTIEAAKPVGDIASVPEESVSDGPAQDSVPAPPSAEESSKPVEQEVDDAKSSPMTSPHNEANEGAGPGADLSNVDNVALDEPAVGDDVPDQLHVEVAVQEALMEHQQELEGVDGPNDQDQTTEGDAVNHDNTPTASEEVLN